MYNENGFDDFVRDVVSELSDKVSDDVSIFDKNILKNNDTYLRGVVFMKTGVNASPTIYLDTFYDSYLQGTSLEEITDSVYELYMESCLNKDMDIDFFNKYEEVQKHLFVKVISLRNNEEMLKDVPYERFLDLAIVAYCKLERTDVGNATILIHKSHVNMWQKTENEVICDAIDNTEKLMKWDIKPMIEALEEYAKEKITDIDMNDETLCKFPMYVVTNTEKCNGSVFMVFKNVVDGFSKTMGGDFVLLPSSIHESILIPADSKTDMYELSNMVKEVNSTLVNKEEILSDRAYYYNSERGIFI